MDDIVAMMDDGDDGFNEDEHEMNDQNGHTPMGATPSGPEPPPPPAAYGAVNHNPLLGGDDEKLGEENTGDDGEGAVVAPAYNPLLHGNPYRAAVAAPPRAN